ncbi:DUF4344 domain-containing metallopeptidase [uncultured Enterovirga sp.]|uniref:DUF4344 domain-containing metallopeptidase n=1 Tax=uncultured Enterovirga sp. TaxID=2026352 RepID=UPI0035C94550
MTIRRLVALAVLASVWTHIPAATGREAAGVDFVYVEPRTPGFRALYDTMRSKRVLERASEVIGRIRLPAKLTLRLTECDGQINAWYSPEDRSVTLCYEYLHDVVHRAPERASPAGITRHAALVGPVVQVLFHETGHAIFDLLKIPVLGREEDAADQVAAYVILLLDPAQAREVIEGSAYILASYAKEEKPEKDAFADMHGLSAQRFYNLVCLAYGSDETAFGFVVDNGYLPKDRAESCWEEYDQVAYAVEKLIAPHLTPKAQLRPHRRLR